MRAGLSAAVLMLLLSCAACESQLGVVASMGALTKSPDATMKAATSARVQFDLPFPDPGVAVEWGVEHLWAGGGADPATEQVAVDLMATDMYAGYGLYVFKTLNARGKLSVGLNRQRVVCNRAYLTTVPTTLYHEEQSVNSEWGWYCKFECQLGYDTNRPKVIHLAFKENRMSVNDAVLRGWLQSVSVGVGVQF